MRTTSLALLEHRHCLPSQGKITAVLDHTDMRVPTERGTDLKLICLALAAIEDQCRSCQGGVSGWIAHHGDPWTVVRLAGPVAADASRLARRAGRVLGRRSDERELLAVAFGLDVARVVGMVVHARDLSPAVRSIEALSPVRRYRLVRDILRAIGQRAVVAAVLSGPAQAGKLRRAVSPA